MIGPTEWTTLSSLVRTRTSRTPTVRWISAGSTSTGRPLVFAALAPGGMTKTSSRAPVERGASASHPPTSTSASAATIAARRYRMGASPHVGIHGHRARAREHETEGDAATRLQRAPQSEQHQVNPARLHLDGGPRD